LDARTDLFSLGATLYYALVGQRPFPARTALELVELWKTSPPAPSALVAGIPEALDRLVLDLIQVDASHRPASASEVMVRLATIAKLPQDEAQLVSRAYLATPSLVGRVSALARAQSAVSAAQTGSGSSLLIHGQPGSGRSRFLDACVLIAKVSGATVLRADASDSSGGEYGAVRALAQRLLETAPEIALVAANDVGPVLAVWMPELRARAPTAFSAPFDPAELQTKLQPGLRDWFLRVSKQRGLMLAIDDVHRIDAASAAVIALLCRAARGHSLLMAATADTLDATAGPPLSLIAETSQNLRLHRLIAEETESMLGSVFGDVPNVGHVARRIHASAHGRPREIMELARHLVDRGVIHYHAGLWSLPESLAADDLPSNMVQALRARIAALRPMAAELAHVMALAPDLRYSLDDCLKLTAAETRDVLAALDELIAAELVASVDRDYMLARPGIDSAILAALDAGRRAELHLRVAALFEHRQHNALRLASQLLAGGADARAVEVLVRHAESSVKETDQDSEAFARLVQSLPPDWLELYGRGVALCRSLGRPRADEFAIHVRVAGLAAFSKVDAIDHFRILYAQLARDVGLDFHATFADLPVGKRLETAFGAAAQRFADTPERERCNDPQSAMRLLSRMVIAGVGNAGITLSVELGQLLPRLEPLVVLSPAIGLVQQLADGLNARLLGANDTVVELYGSIVDQLSQQSLGLDATYRNSIRLSLTYVLGTLEATMGLATGLERARELEQSPLYEVNATIIRMLHHVWQGDVREAQRCKELVELLNLERMRPQGVDGGHLPRELLAYVAVDDLTRVKQMLASIEQMAAKLPGWRPLLHWGRGEYERIRGDLSAAESELAQAFRAMAPEGHLVWANVAAAHVNVLTASGRVDEACTLGADYLAQASARQLLSSSHAIRMPLAIAYAKRGDPERALALAEQVVGWVTLAGSTGIRGFLAHETRARVAAILGDEEAFAKHAVLCRAQIPAGTSGALSAKYERLLREGMGANPASIAWSRAGVSAEVTLMRSQIASVLDTIKDSEGRALRCLEFLLRSCGAQEGYLFSLRQGELVPLVQIAEDELPDTVAALARDLIKAETSDDDTMSTSDAGLSSMLSQWTYRVGFAYRPVLLRRDDPNGAVLIGLALVLAPNDRPFQYPLQVATEIAKHLDPPTQVRRP
jgi:hypothetical protein